MPMQNNTFTNGNDGILLSGSEPIKDNEEKILFLDFDGPLLPRRCYVTAANTKKVWSQFDPVAVAMINNLVQDSGAKIVISSTWRSHGYHEVSQKLRDNGIDPTNLHADWKTQDTIARRAIEIENWLSKHPYVKIWCAIDDEPCLLSSGWVQCSFDDGISWANYQKAREILGIKKESSLIDLV